ncbi:MAG TPA: hypothetical protein VNA20_02010 [Frankiaceae bacterium]|nr:hypothetical protein [Frankiaceae bacterium]
MNRPSFTLREARTYAAVATLAGLTTAGATGAATNLTAGPRAGLAVAVVTAAATVGGTLAALRLRVTCRD